MHLKSVCAAHTYDFIPLVRCYVSGLYPSVMHTSRTLARRLSARVQAFFLFFQKIISSSYDLHFRRSLYQRVAIKQVLQLLFILCLLILNLFLKLYF